MPSLFCMVPRPREMQLHYQIWSDMEKMTKKEVQPLVLNRVPSTVAASAIRGIPLAINDWGLYLGFLDVVTEESEDFINFVINDYMERNNLEKGD